MVLDSFTPLIDLIEMYELIRTKKYIGPTPLMSPYHSNIKSHDRGLQRSLTLNSMNDFAFDVFYFLFSTNMA